MKRIISVLLCASLLSALLVGCSSGKDDASSDNQEKQIALEITVDNHYSSFDEATKSAYKKLCNAVLAYESSVKFNIGLVDEINTLFYTSFPLYTLVKGIDFAKDNSGVEISYVYPQEEHKQRIEQFNNAVAEIMSECGYGKVSKNIYVLNVYSYLSQNITIDGTTTTVLETAVTKKGMSSTVSGLFEYLLLQSDIPASHVINVGENSLASMISMAQLNGEMYYFDISSEIEKTDGKGLSYFAMNTQRAADKDAKLTFTDGSEINELDNDYFGKLANCTDYKVEGNKVVANCKGENFTFELN